MLRLARHANPRQGPAFSKETGGIPIFGRRAIVRASPRLMRLKAVLLAPAE
jgi:hypothetical protein